MMLDGMDLDGLKELRRKLDRAIANYETRKRQEAFSALEQAAKEHGFKLEELRGEGTSGRGRKTKYFAAKNVNPEDPEQTWSGRG
ncbi:H-NS histone family protein, partial [Pseudomonas syringae group genomosp. 7]